MGSIEASIWIAKLLRLLVVAANRKSGKQLKKIYKMPKDVRVKKRLIMYVEQNCITSTTEQLDVKEEERLVWIES